MPRASRPGVAPPTDERPGVKPPACDGAGVEPPAAWRPPPGPGVSPASAEFGVGACRAPGVIPPKSPSFESGAADSPPSSGVLPDISAACAAASSRIVSSPPATRGVRIDDADGVCSYEFCSSRVASEPPSS